MPVTPVTGGPLIARARQQCVQELVDSPDLLYLLRAVVGRFQDVEKIHSFCIQQHDWVRITHKVYFLLFQSLSYLRKISLAVQRPSIIFSGI